MSPSRSPLSSRRSLLLIGAASVVVLGLAGTPANAGQAGTPRPGSVERLARTARERVDRFSTAPPSVGPQAVTPGDTAGTGRVETDGSEAIMEQAEQYAEARSAPGIVAPGAYSAAWNDLRSLPRAPGRWQDETQLPYNADDPRYRDVNSNSSSGAGLVTGRVTGLAADDAGYVYAGSANGGVFRSRTGGGRWEPISDRLPSPATGDLRLDARGRLWYATGEANTAAVSFVGTGVYLLNDPRHGAFTPADRVGGAELESTTIRELRFSGDTVWAATNRGVWTHSTTTRSGPWHLEFAPNPDYLPGGANASDPNAPYKNIVNDVAFDPQDPSKVLLAVGWRSGDTYNGFYTRQDGAWQRVTLPGDMPSDADNVGAVTFTPSADGARYYAVDQSPTLLAKNPDSALQGVYVSTSGSPFGPWTQIVDYKTLSKSGSAMTQDGYQPGVQSWYNQFLQVDPADHDHLYLGLEEVYETTDAGQHWRTVGPYWNFPFACWSIDPSKQSGNCPQTTHPDQHAVTVGRSRGKTLLYVGNDGGTYRRPVNGQVDAAGHATDWTSLNDGTMDALQYYSVGIGRDRGTPGSGTSPSASASTSPSAAAGSGAPTAQPDHRGTTRGRVAITGGLQDNGQSILRPGDRVMGSNFGGDGGDTLVDPDNVCNTAQEYVYLDIWVTNNCAVNAGGWVTDPTKATSYEVAPPDTKKQRARFIAPFTADTADPKTWVAGGQHVWIQHNGFAIRSSAEWQNVFDLGENHTATAVVSSGGSVYVGWCGPCNNQGFTRGIAVGHADGTGWHQLDLPVDGPLPNRYISGFDVDPADATHVVVAINGFSRKWTEGPGAGIGHVFDSRDGGVTWTDVSANMPDIPANWVRMIPGGGLMVATDAAVLYQAPGRREWQILGDNLPTTAVLQLRHGPGDLRIYAATHGRGIWSYDLRQLAGRR